MMKAFPEVEYVKPAGEIGVSIMTIHGGMDLRDYFAGQALVGILAHPDTKPDSWVAAKASYQVADNMMKAREE